MDGVIFRRINGRLVPIKLDKHGRNAVDRGFTRGRKVGAAVGGLAGAYVGAKLAHGAMPNILSHLKAFKGAVQTAGQTVARPGLISKFSVVGAPKISFSQKLLGRAKFGSKIINSGISPQLKISAAAIGLVGAYGALLGSNLGGYVGQENAVLRLYKGQKKKK
jgi:hypothetical protein